MCVVLRPLKADRDSNSFADKTPGRPYQGFRIFLNNTRVSGPHIARSSLMLP